MFHAFYGVYIAFTATNNTKRFGTFRNWMFILQRFTGIFLVIFIAWHIFQTRVQKAIGEEVNFDMMAEIVANPWMLAFYIVGILSATFHLANGIMVIPSKLGNYTITEITTNRNLCNNGILRNLKYHWCSCNFSIRLIEL